DHCHPFLGVAFALSHSGLERFFGDRLVRKYPNPYLATALDAAVDGDTASLDLARSQSPAIGGLDGEVAKIKVAATIGLTAHPALLLFSVFNLLGYQHTLNLCLLLRRRRRRGR